MNEMSNNRGITKIKEEVFSSSWYFKMAPPLWRLAPYKVKWLLLGFWNDWSLHLQFILNTVFSNIILCVNFFYQEKWGSTPFNGSKWNVETFHANHHLFSLSQELLMEDQQTTCSCFFSTGYALLYPFCSLHTIL